MNWSIRVPFRDDSDFVSELAFGSLPDRYLSEAEATICREMAKEAMDRGIHTIGQLKESLARRSPEERRQLLDRWRERANLPTTAEVERNREIRRMLADDLPDPPSQVGGLRRDHKGRAMQRCPACGVYPTQNGMPVPHRAKKWWCPEHRDKAAEGDMDDWQAPRYFPLHPQLTEEDKAYYAEIDRKRRELEEQKERHRQAEGEAIARAKERWHEEGEVSVMGIKVKPKNVRFHA